MELSIILLSASLLIVGILLLAIAIKKPGLKKQRIEQKIGPVEIEEINKINTTDPTKELQELTRITKKFIKRIYRLSDKLSLNELITELENKQDQRLKKICEKIREHYYKNNKIDSTELAEIRKEIISTINLIELERSQKKLELKQNETLVDKIRNKEFEMKEQIRIQRIKHSRLKRKKIKTLDKIPFGQ